MIFLRPTDGAKLVMKKWIEELYAQPWSKTKKSNDQPAFNWALNKTAGQVSSLCLPIIANIMFSMSYILTYYLFDFAYVYIYVGPS